MPFIDYFILCVGPAVSVIMCANSVVAACVRSGDFDEELVGVQQLFAKGTPAECVIIANALRSIH
eukprot:gene39951-61300_t